MKHACFLGSPLHSHTNTCTESCAGILNHMALQLNCLTVASEIFDNY